ncbi:MAG TPA: GtrA family protein [Roseiarcus sp.]|nr:GtrA family protein [Roseiarcus sp.]
MDCSGQTGRRRSAWRLPGGEGRLAELLRFAAVGVSAAAIYFVAATALAALGRPLAESSAVAYLLGGIFSFFGHRAFTFASRGPLKAEALRFALLNAVGFLVATGAPVVLTDWLGAPPAWAMAVACVIAPTVNYLAMRSLVFVRGRLPTPDAAARKSP